MFQKTNPSLTFQNQKYNYTLSQCFPPCFQGLFNRVHMPYLFSLFGCHSLQQIT